MDNQVFKMVKDCENANPKYAPYMGAIIRDTALAVRRHGLLNVVESLKNKTSDPELNSIAKCLLHILDVEAVESPLKKTAIAMQRLNQSKLAAMNDESQQEFFFR